MTNTPTAISTRNLWKVFKQGRRIVKALRDVSLDVAAGEFLALRGTSGSGKSTLLNIVGGLDVPTAGDAVTLGISLASLSRSERGAFRRAHIGFVFQELVLVPHLTAFENVLLAVSLERGGRARARDVALRMFEEVGLSERADHRPHELSYGERQRVAILRAVIRGPKLLLADEPTANLDDANVNGVQHILSRLQQEGTTVIVATHDPRLEACADRIQRIETGQLRD